MGSDLAGIELIKGIEGAFNLLQFRVEIAEKGRRKFRAHTLAVFAPEQTIVFTDQGDNLIGNLAHQLELGLVL